MNFLSLLTKSKTRKNLLVLFFSNPEKRYSIFSLQKHGFSKKQNYFYRIRVVSPGSDSAKRNE